MRFIRLSFLLGAFLVVPGAVPAAESTAAPASPWGRRPSDLPSDPLLVDGVLPNGVRYLILPNAEPKDQVSMRLVIAAGSVHENDDERGLAHFVEHMAFRGTREFPEGKMTAALQRLGMAPGPDNTAFTTFDHTIYHLELPNAQDTTVRAAVHMFREYAEGVTFDPALIERERGVILSEMAMRDTPDARSSDYNLGLLWPKSREAMRKPIGTTTAIRSFTRSQFVAFYDAWYRPERIGLIFVGAVDPAHIRQIVADELGSMVARAPARPAPPDLVTRECAVPDVGVFSDPRMTGFSIVFERPRLVDSREDTHEDRVRRLRRDVAFAMFQLRLRKLADQPQMSFAVPSASVNEGFQNWEVATVGVGGRINTWQTAAMELEMEHRRALRYGFTRTELEETRAAYTMYYQETVRSASTRPSPSLAQHLSRTLLYGHVYATPEAWQRDMLPELAKINLEDCRAAFRAAWLPGGLTVYVAANSVFGATRRQVAATLNTSREVTVDAPAEAAVAQFGYGDFGSPGQVVREERLEDLDVTLAEFANGVRLNFKPTRFEADAVEVRVRIGVGKLSQLKSQPGLDLLAGAAFTAGGLGRHSEQELGDILAGHAVQLAFQIHSDACAFYGRCAPAEIDLLLRLIAAYVTDASYRPEAMKRAETSFGSMFSALAASPGGPVTMKALRDVFDNDPRFGIPPYEELSSRNLSEISGWLEPQLKKGPIELSIVGDIPWANARQAVATTLGALGQRSPPANVAPHLPVHLAPVPANPQVYLIAPGLKQIAVAWYWPVEAVADIKEERRCYLLAAVLQERLRVKLREEVGATYAPVVGFQRMDGFPNVNYFVFYAEVEPSRTRQAFTIVQREAEALSKKGPLADEFERAKQPYVRSMTDELRTNSYWGDTVLSDAQQHPSRIVAARDRAADIVAINRSEIAVLAKRYLNPERAYRFATLPLRGGSNLGGAQKNQ